MNTDVFDLVQSVIDEATLHADPSQRWRASQDAARLLASIVVSRRDDLWQLVAESAPHYAEWASWFALVQANSRVTSRQADDLVRDVQDFYLLVTSERSRPAGENLEARAGHG